MALPSLVHSPQNWSDPSERGLNEGVRRSSSDGRRPPIANRGGREDSPHMALAGLRFPRKIGPNRPSGASTKEIAGARRPAMARTPTVAAERIHRTWTSPAYVFPAKLVRTVRTGPRRKSSPELAGRPPAGGGPTANRGGREDSPPTTIAGLCFFPQIWSHPSERGLAGKVRRTSPDHRGRAVAG